MKIFDDHSKTYVNSTAKLLKFFTSDYSYIHLIKVRLLKKNCEKPKTILDLGCGVGLYLNHLKKEYENSQIFATDPSIKSLEIAKKNYEGINFIQFKEIEKYSFDLIMVNGVFHHIEPENRQKEFNKIYKILKKDGTVFLTEHNPYNPVTRKIVSNCEYDEDAELITMKNMKKIISHSNLDIENSGYFLYFPYFLRILNPIEKILKKLPLGGQYFISAKKNS